MSFSPSKVLVTGSAGFIGSNFVELLLNDKSLDKVVSLDKLTYAGSLENLKIANNDKRHLFIEGDIGDFDLICSILREHEIDAVINFAAESHVDRSIKEPFPFVQTNVLGTQVLLESALTIWMREQNRAIDQCRFHHISTDEVFGSLASSQRPSKEDDTYYPSSPYSASKAASDHFVRAYFKTYDLPITISNCSNNYGPKQHNEKLIPSVMRSCLAHEPIQVYGDGQNIRDWLYVGDHCMAIESILRYGKVGETYNIGGDSQVNNLTLVKLICSIFDKLYPASFKYESLIQFVSDRPGHDWRYDIDFTKIKQELNWQPRQDLISGLEKTVRYYLSKIQTFDLCND